MVTLSDRMCFSHSPEFVVDLNLLTALLTCASPDARIAAYMLVQVQLCLIYESPHVCVQYSEM